MTNYSDGRGRDADSVPYKAVLFDLDGTLLPLDQDTFVKVYFTHLTEYMAKLGYDPKEYIGNIMKSTFAMKENDGSRTNEAVFWESYCGAYGEEARGDEAALEQFYLTDFSRTRAVTGTDPAAAETVRRLKAKGISVTVATSPLFPRVAVNARIEWAGLDRSDFDLVTTYENMTYCKPNPEYYKEVCRILGVSPEDCIMVGNDVDEDMIAETVGMKVFYLTDNPLNRNGKDTSRYPQGGFPELWEFLGI